MGKTLYSGIFIIQFKYNKYIKRGRKKMVSIKIKLLFVSLFIALVPLLLLGGVNLDKTTDTLSSNIEDSLNTIIKSKESALQSFIVATEKTANSFADTSSFKEYAGYLNRDDLTLDEMAAFEEIEFHVADQIHAFMEGHWGVEYHHIYIADKSGEVVLSPNHGELVKGSPKSHLDQKVSENVWFEKALVSTQVTDYYSFPESTHHHQVLFSPIKDSNGVTQGVIGFELMITHELEILQKGIELGEKGKVYLTTLDGLSIEHDKEIKQKDLTSKGLKTAMETGFSSGRTINSEGNEVIGYYLKNDKYPWIMAAEIDAEQAFESVKNIRQYILAGLIITTLIVIILTLFLSNYLTKPLKQLTKVADMLTDGDFNVNVPQIKTNDEIKQLSMMTAMLVDTIRFLKKNKDKGEKNE